MHIVTFTLKAHWMNPNKEHHNLNPDTCPKHQNLIISAWGVEEMAVITCKWSFRQNKATVRMCPRHILGTPLSRTVRLKFPCPSCMTIIELSDLMW